MYQMVSQFLNYRRGVPRSRSGDFLVIYVIEVSPLTTDNSVVKPNIGLPSSSEGILKHSHNERDHYEKDTSSRISWYFVFYVLWLRPEATSSGSY